ncbi:MAG: cytochrome c [Dehalococcoidia bacterium]
MELRRWSVFTLGGAFIALALVACGGDAEESGEPAATEAVTEAATQASDAAASPAGLDPDAKVQGMAPAEFFAANCAVCHGAKREGIDGLGLPLTPAVLTQEDALYQDTIRDGRSGTAMPAMGQNLGMSDEDIATLVTFLKTVEP